MARTMKDVAEYYPHFVADSRTKSILEGRYGNDGYAFWFKLLELLCKTDGHAYDCRDALNMEYLIGYTRVSAEIAEQILDLLANLGKIDRELWTENRIIWCQTLVNNLKSVYEKRKRDVPQKPSFLNRKPGDEVDFCPENESTDAFSGQPVEKKRQSKVEYSRVEYSKEPPIIPPAGDDDGDEEKNLNRQGESLTVLKTAGMAAGNETREQPSTTPAQERFLRFWSAYPKRVGKGYAEKIFTKLNPDDTLLAAMLSAIEKAKRSEQWQRDKGQYIPNPSTWLNQTRWEDELPGDVEAPEDPEIGPPKELPPDLAKEKERHEEAMRRFRSGECSWEELVPE
ncbi:DUF4373 domain-containing protein [Anaeromassilibacillus senegalensis]|uniref:DUF4373 domain-containing protein n=1 Tax=Anaeromassilibacillus senegalensis TaxID=1673717 RepID=UPI00067FE090|nr:DUF4373 domain-containing protein [Anaeromassilibacillus senegalensis]